MKVFNINRMSTNKNVINVVVDIIDRTPTSFPDTLLHGRAQHETIVTEHSALSGFKSFTEFLFTF